MPERGITLRELADHLILQAADGAPPTRGGGQMPHGLRVDGRFFVADNAATYRPLYASCLYGLMQQDDGLLTTFRQLRELGFNGVRVFAGHLGQIGQDPELARRRLPAFIALARGEGLNVYVCAITGGRDPQYDVEQHLAAVADLCAGFNGVLLEGANELGHPSLSERASDPAWLRATMRRVVPPGLVWTLGAPLHTDEPTPDGQWPAWGGMFNDAHLDRGRDKWNQVRRLRELYAVRETQGTPVFNGEPIGADEQMGGSTGTKQRRNDPDFFYAMGALSRGFELATVFHSEDGLHGRPLGPVQQQCAREFVAGWRALPTDERLSFVNAGWAGSPVAGANFDRVTRCYSFVTGDHGWTVLVGISGDPAVRWGGGWQPTGDAHGWPGVQVLEIRR